MVLNYPQKNQKGRRTREPVVVETPYIEEHPPEEKDVTIIDGANGSRYKLVGKCLACKKEVYQCISAPLIDPVIEATIGVVIVPNSRPAFPTRDTIPEKPSYYCQDHHPYKHMRNRHGKKLEGGATVDGDSWAPLR